MINKLGNCLLRRFIGAPKQLFDSIVFNRHKKALFEEYEASNEEVIGILIRQDTNGSQSCPGLNYHHGKKTFYCYEDPNFGLTVVRPAVRINMDVVSENLQLKLLPDHPNSGYPQFLIEKWLRDYASWKIYIFLLVMYVPLTLFLSYMVAIVGNVIFVYQYYPLCTENFELGNSCYPWVLYFLALATVLLVGYLSAKKSFSKWKYQMLEKEINGLAARELLRHLPKDHSSSRPNLYDNPRLADVDSSENDNESKKATAPLIARV